MLLLDIITLLLLIDSATLLSADAIAPGALRHFAIFIVTAHGHSSIF
jgi:hypothetical protein